MLTKPNSKLRFRRTASGWEWSDGDLWYRTFRSKREILDMHPTLSDDGEEDESDSDLEVFGDTLDEPLPDDLVEMLMGVNA